MKRISHICIVFALLLVPFSLSAQGLKGFKLANGLTVYIWEDDTRPDVYGLVGVNVGATSDPENLTGLAHYLEHVIFKGTEKIGTTDWEKERPLYEQIIAKYDEMAATSDPVRKGEISKEINKLSVDAAQYMVGNEFALLTEETGGTRLNAGTSYDYTVYHNVFPPTEIYRWLELNSERFINPVFRAFQSELETVYEEYNMTQDEQNRQVASFMLENMFPGHPYSRNIVGKPEHLKNPQLSALIQFYNDWYVPENMVLVLVGNVKASQVRGIIQDKFGRLEAKPSPERKVYPDWGIKGRKTVSAKLTPYPQVLLVFQGVPRNHPDLIPLQICMSLLSNRSDTGLLDKLTLEGDLMSASASCTSFKEQGRLMISGIPDYDINQRRFSSLRDTERILQKEIKKVQNGEIDEWLIESIQGSMIRMFDLAFESSKEKAEMIAQAFANGQDIADVLSYKERVAAVTIDEIKAVAKKYLTNDFLVLDMLDGKSPNKKEKLEKPEYEKITPQRNVRSAYAENFSKLPVMKKEPEFCDFNTIQRRKINELSELFYTPNKENEVFTLTLKYGVGTEEMPKLDYAVQLMNNAGIMGLLEPQELKQAFSELGATCHFRVDDSYLYIIMEGYEARLLESCNLLTRQILMPKLEEKQLNNIIGGEMQQRRMEKDYVERVKDAASQYLFYGDKSSYIDRLPLEDIQSMSVSSLTGEFNRATDYEAEVHYVGSLSFDEIYEVLSKNLPLKANEKPTSSPQVKDRVSYNENTIFFLPENDAQQSAIYFFIEGKPTNTKDKAVINAFNQYFDGSFNGLVVQEIREYRSMAYHTYGRLMPPSLQGKNYYLDGFVGTQSDKTVEAVELYLSLLQDMPSYPERMENIKEYLKKAVLTNKPSFRNASLQYEEWKLQGYDQDPAATQLPLIEQLTFEDVYRFYENEVKGKPVGIIIVGDPKHIDTKTLEKFGKVQRINKNRLFSTR